MTAKALTNEQVRQCVESLELSIKAIKVAWEVAADAGNTLEQSGVGGWTTVLWNEYLTVDALMREGTARVLSGAGGLQNAVDALRFRYGLGDPEPEDGGDAE